MRLPLPVCALLGLLFFCLPVWAQPNPSIATLPLAFEPNAGQAPADQLYLTRSAAMQIGFSPNTVRLNGLSMTLVGGSRDPQITVSEKTGGESNYLLGDQPSSWKTHIPQYGRLTYKEVYPGINLTFYGSGGRVEHDFVVQPGADYRQIKLQYEGARKLAITPDGDLQVAVSDGELTVHAPHIYQQAGGNRQDRSGRFVLRNREVSFKVDAFDPSLPLVIDPVLDYSTYLANLSLYVYSAAVDASGNTYITGLTFSSAYPVTSGDLQATCASCPDKPDVFITKLNATGTAQVYSTFLGGSGYDQPSSIAVDSNGNAVVGGYTGSTDFPLKNAISSGTPTSDDGFVTSLAHDGASLNFSSRLGGGGSNLAGSTYAWSVTTDTSGNAYVAGTTGSPYLPVTPGALNAASPTYADNYVFLTKFAPAGNLVYSGILGATGSASECCSVVGLAVDSTGNAYVAGTVGVTDISNTTPWPITPGAYQSQMISPNNIAPFVAKVSADGSTLLYSTLVTTGIASSMALTSDSQVILAGTAYPNYPVTSDAFSSTVGTSFIAKLNADGSQLAYSTYFSTPTADTGAYITKLAVDGAGDVWVGGNTSYTQNVPMVLPLQSVPGLPASVASAFVSEFDPQLHNLLFSTYFNGVQSGSSIAGLAMDGQGRAHIAGTGSYDMPTTPSALLGAVTPPPPNYTYYYGFAALIDPAAPGPGICFPRSVAAYAEVGSSAQTSLTITNCGSAPLTINSVQLSSPVFALGSAGNCIATLTAQATCTVSLTFTPVAAGNSSATVTVTSNATIPTYNISVTGLGTAPTILVLPNSITFPAQVLGDSASGSNLTVVAANTGTAPLVVYPAQSVTTGDFSIVSNNCGTPVPSPVSPTQGSSCTFTIAFNPSALGARTGTLTIASNDPVHPTLTIPLSGTAIAAYIAPALTGLSVPSVALGTTPFSLPVTGTNFFPASYVVIGGEPQPTTYNNAGLLTATVDPSLLTVMGELPVYVVNPAPGGQSNTLTLTVVRALPISAAGLVYASSTNMLYASVPASAATNANTVLPIDPLTGKIGTPIPVGNDPGKLALSSDGAYLYAGMNGDHTLQRINLSTSQVERTFALPAGSLSPVTTVHDMHGVPGSPQSVVVSLFQGGSPGEAGTALYNDAGQVSFLSNNGIDGFAFTSSPSVLYAYPFSGNFFSETGVSASGLSVISSAPVGSCCNQVTGSLVASDGTLLYTNSGQVWNPQTAALVGTYTPASGSLFYEPSVVPDTANQRTFMLDTLQTYSASVTYVAILSFDQVAYTQAGTLLVAVQNFPSSIDLDRWGADGFAFRVYSQAPADEIVILRSSLVHTATGGTPSLTSLVPSSVAVGSATSQITVNGSGFLPGTTVLWNGVALETLYVSATQLQVNASASEFASPGTAWITAVNPAPGGTSSALSFSVNGPLATLSSNAVDFGSVITGATSAVAQITLSNPGQGALTLSSIAAAGDFAETNNCGASVAIGGSCIISITFTPTAAGARTGTLTFTDNAPASPQTIALSGTGTAPTVTISSSSPTLTVPSAGGSITATIQLSPQGGFTGMVNLTCAVTYQGQGTPADPPTCALNPARAQLTGNTPVSSTLTITTTAASSPAVAFAAVFFLALLPRRRWRNRVLLTLLCLGAVIGCGGGADRKSATSDPGTTAGNYQVVVTANSGSMTASTVLPLVLQ